MRLAIYWLCCCERILGKRKEYSLFTNSNLILIRSDDWKQFKSINIDSNYQEIMEMRLSSLCKLLHVVIAK